jgi:glutathione S-transferase
VITLITIPASHYCEKARWALERGGVPYTESAHLPFFSRWATWRAGHKGSVPVLVTPEGLVTDSTDILRWVDARLPAEARLLPAGAPGDEIARWEERFDKDLGPATRRLGYRGILADRATTIEVLEGTVPRGQMTVLKLTFPLVAAQMRRGLKIDEAGVARSRAKVDAVCADVEQALADGRRYLVGDRFTAADLTFAALIAPLLLPARYGGVLPARDKFTAEIQSDIDALRARPAGKYALSIYDERPRPQH